MAETESTLTHLRREADRVRAVGDRLAVALWVVAAGGLIVTMVNVFLLAVHHGMPQQTAWLVDPLLSIALFTVLVGDGVLARNGCKSTGWAQVLKYGAGSATLALNVWQAVADRDGAAILLHSVTPVLVIALAEVTPAYRLRFASLADTLAGRAAAAANEAAERERQAAEREAERTLELKRLAAEREAREHELELARVREAEANAAAELERLKAERQAARSANGGPGRGRTSRPNATRTTAPNGPNGADDLARRRKANEAAFTAWSEREGTERLMSNTELAGLLGVSVDAARTQANRWRKAAGQATAVAQ